MLKQPERGYSVFNPETTLFSPFLFLFATPLCTLPHHRHLLFLFHRAYSESQVPTSRASLADLSPQTYSSGSQRSHPLSRVPPLYSVLFSPTIVILSPRRRRSHSRCSLLIITPLSTPRVVLGLHFSFHSMTLPCSHIIFVVERLIRPLHRRRYLLEKARQKTRAIDWTNTETTRSTTTGSRHVIKEKVPVGGILFSLSLR